MLEEWRTDMINAISQFINKQKRKRINIKEEECTKLKEGRSQLKTKIEYLDKTITILGSNIGACTGFDVIEMKIEALKALTEFEAYGVGDSDTEVTFVSG